MPDNAPGQPKGNRWLRKMRVFFDGIRHALLTDFNVSYKAAVSSVALLITGYFYNWTDFLLILVATAQVIFTELFNNAIEGLCDYIQPNKDEKIKVIKDVAAAAASIAMLVWVIVMAVQIGQILKLHLLPSLGITL